MFNILNCKAVLSAATGIIPPSASISRTTIPFAGPPTLGLHGIEPIISLLNVTIAVFLFIRLAAKQASIPACPAPITKTSYIFFTPDFFLI